MKSPILFLSSLCLGVFVFNSAMGAETVPGPRILLDGEWRFRTDADNVGVEQRWFADGLESGASSRPSGPWQTVRVPRNWDDYGLKNYDGVGWFVREFEIPADGSLSNWGLVLMAVDDRADVWVNATSVTEQPRTGERIGFSLDGVARAGRNTLAVRVEDVGGPGGIVRSVWLGRYKREVEELFDGPFRDLPARHSHDWVRDAVVYEVYLRSFSPEGTFRGLEARLSELKNLGVTVLWLMPIHPVGVINRKGMLGSPYSVRDFLAVNPEFGTMADFESLVRTAHAQGLKLIIDLVANHTAWDGPVFEQHPDWYTRNAQGNIVSPVPDWSDTADLNFDVPAVRAYMNDAMQFWVREEGIDGFRCDVAGMVPLDFWESVVPKLDARKQIMMLAEDDAPAQHVRAFDLTYDWRTWTVLGRLTSGTLTPGDFRNLLRDEDYEFPRGSLRMRFSDNHDKCAWETPALPRYGPAVKAAALLTFALPGVPLIYNGQEVGNTQKLSLFEKMPIDWQGDRHGLRALYTDLCRVRRENVALRRGECALLNIHDHLGILTVIRQHADQRVVAFINLRPQPVQCFFFDELRSARQLLADGANQTGATLSLAPFGFWVGGE